MFFAVAASATAFLAASLTADSVGTLMPSIALTPLFCASITTSLVVALVISSFALSAAVLASCVNAVFSSVVKLLAELISSNFLVKASSIALFASDFTVSKLVGTMFLIASTPAWPA